MKIYLRESFSTKKTVQMISGIVILFLLTASIWQWHKTFRFGLVEYGVFVSYPESLVKDGDLNIINQLPKDFSWIASTQLNDVDYHDYGIVSLMAPLMYLGKWMGLDHLQDYYGLVFTAINVFMVFASFFLINQILQILFGLRENYKIYILLYFINVPVWWYLLFHLMSSDIASMFLLSSILYFYLKNLKSDQWHVIFYQALLLVVATTVKVTFFFSIFIWSHYLYINRKNLKKIFSTFLIFFLAAALVYPFHIYYIIQKYGTFYVGYIQDIDLKLVVLKEILFSQNGYLVSSPIYWFSLIGFVLLFYGKKLIASEHRSLLIILGIGFAVKTVLVSFRRIEDELFGSRMILLDTFYFLSLFVFSLNSLFENRKKIIGYSTLVAGALYNIFLLGIYVNDTSQWNGKYDFSIEHSIKGLNNLFFVVQNTHIFESLFSYWFLVPLISLLVFLISALRSFKNEQVLLIFVILMYGTYLSGHVLHIVNKEKNIELLKKTGFYENKLIVKGPLIFNYDDFLSGMDKSMFYAKVRGDKQALEKRKKILEKYLIDIQTEIVYDPIHFIEDLKAGKIRRSGHDTYR